jgi:hypothetical protein
MIIGKVSNGIAFSPFLETPSIATPRSAQSLATSSQIRRSYNLPSHAKSLSQFNGNISKEAIDILESYRNEGLYPENTSKNKIRNLKKFGFLEDLSNAFSIIVNKLSKTDKEYYTIRFNNDVQQIEKKLNNQSKIMRGGYNNSPLNLIKISPVKFSSASPRGVSPDAQELLSDSQLGTPPAPELSSASSRGISPDAKELTFVSQLGTTTAEQLLSPSSQPRTPLATELSSASKLGTSVERGDDYKTIITKRLSSTPAFGR